MSRIYAFIGCKFKDTSACSRSIAMILSVSSVNLIPTFCTDVIVMNQPWAAYSLNFAEQMTHSNICKVKRLRAPKIFQ